MHIGIQCYIMYKNKSQTTVYVYTYKYLYKYKNTYIHPCVCSLYVRVSVYMCVEREGESWKESAHACVSCAIVSTSCWRGRDSIMLSLIKYANPNSCML